MKRGGAGSVGWARTHLVSSDVVNHFVVTACECHGCPSAEGVAILIGDSADYVALCNCHRAARFELGVELDRAAAEFDGVMVEGLLCGSVASIVDFEVSGVKIVLNYSSYVCLHQALVLEEFVEGVTVVSSVESISVLGVYAGCVGVFLFYFVADWCV